MSIAAILVAILVFGVIVLIHEFGHFIAARRCGIRVLEFAVGMGPRLFSFQPGETLYSLRLFPIGGSCQMLGEDATGEEYAGYDAAETSMAFNNQPVWQRMIVILAGVFMNFVLALAVSVIIVFVADGYSTPVVQEVLPDTPAAAIGLVPGDRIIEINGVGVHIYDDLAFELYQATGEPMRLVVLRGTERIETTVTPALQESAAGKAYKIGFLPVAKTGLFAPETDGMARTGVMESFATAFYRDIFIVKSTFAGLFQLVTGRVSVDQMAGPIQVIQVVGESYDAAAQISIKTAVIQSLEFVAFLSVNIGVFNLLPIPALDGGRFLFLLVEGIRRKPVKRETEGMVHLVGFALLMVLAVFIAYNDIMKIIG